MLSLEVKNISKVYRLGQLNTKTAIKSVFNKLTNNANIIVSNNRSQKAVSEYVYALQNINFDVPQGQVLGIIGKNGAGKSTLLKVLSQITSPTTGHIKINGRMASLLEVGTGFHPDLTGKENIFLNGAILGMNKKEIQSKLDEIIHFSGVEQYIDTPVKRYSSGMQVRLAFAVAAHLEPDIMIVDEVLAVGDAEFQEKCIGKMKDVSGQGRTVLFVSHSMSTIRSLCTRGILLSNGTLSFDGSVEDCIDGYLKSNIQLANNGDVPSNMSVLNNGMAQIKQVQLIDFNNTQTNVFRFKSNINIKCKVDFVSYSGQILVGIQLKNIHNEKIIDFVNQYDNTTLNVNKGINELMVSLTNNLLPGKYYGDITIALPTGVVIDLLENVLEFTVSNLGETANTNYPYPYINAFIQGNASWKLHNE